MPRSEAKALALAKLDAERLAERRAAGEPTRLPVRMNWTAPTVTADEARERNRLAEENRQCAKIAELLEASGIPKLYRKARDPDWGVLPSEVIDQYRQKWDRIRTLETAHGMVALLGPRGTGKTWMACAMVRRFCEAVRPARYMEAMDYFVALQETYGDRAKKTQSQVEAEGLRPELLVLDAMEERADTPWNDRMLTRLINKRYAAELSTVLISNETPAEFSKRVGESITDRIRDCGGRIECGWNSLRGRVRQSTPEP